METSTVLVNTVFIKNTACFEGGSIPIYTLNSTVVSMNGSFHENIASIEGVISGVKSDLLISHSSFNKENDTACGCLAVYASVVNISSSD